MPRKPSDFSPGDVFKFVRVDGQYRLATRWVDHCDMVSRSEKAESAGLIAVQEGGLLVMNKRSETLGISMLPEDYGALMALFGKQKIEDWKGF